MDNKEIDDERLKLRLVHFGEERFPGGVGKFLFSLDQEAEDYRDAIRGWSKYRRERIFSPNQPYADQASKFWYRNHVAIQALMLIMDNAVNGRCTLLSEYMKLVKGTAPTKRKVIADAEAEGYLLLEMIDKKRKMIRPSTLMLNAYEKIGIGQIRAIREAMGRNFDADGLIKSYDRYIEKFHRVPSEV